jgi:predicted ABC-type ATPase
MADPVLHLLSGPNGAGKSTLFETVIGPATHLDFINADIIALERRPDGSSLTSYEAARVAADRRAKLIDARTSFATETVFSHGSKLELVQTAVDAGYLVTLHVVMVPETLAVARVASRVAAGGHAVPEEKVRERYARLWPLVASAIDVADFAIVYDNSRAAQPFRVVARFERGSIVGHTFWPEWTPLGPDRTTA